ncbi:MAG: DUF3526 domain-containing protein [Pseudomonadota bacterium]
MSVGHAVSRETRFMLRDRAAVVALVFTLVLSSVAVVGGLSEVRYQRATLERVLVADAADREEALASHNDWGSVAYYSFHLAYDPPSDFAYAALGQRDSAPWKHRIRMLALEGQIYERDAGNPVFALIGRFDFSFFAAFVLPLVLIALLHDLRSSERSAGRHNLLEATAGAAGRLWRVRALVRSAALFVAAILPLAVGGMVSGTALTTLAAASGLVLVYVLCWSVVAYRFSAAERPSGFILASLIGMWALLAIVVPTGARIAIDTAITLPAGSEILLTQREAVNDAWDLPESATMEPFIERHPEYAEDAYVPHREGGFEWKWYYAFQQVGDQKTEALSQAYRAGRERRDQAASVAALLAPPALLERLLQRFAGTDTQATLRYEQHVRKFHAELRQYYYPKLFKQMPFSQDALSELPEFEPR